MSPSFIHVSLGMPLVIKKAFLTTFAQTCAIASMSHVKAVNMKLLFLFM